MKILNLIAVLLVLAIVHINVSQSYAAEIKDVPLMVIRFNQEFVSYEKPLEKVVISAMEVKPKAFFDIITIVPETNSPEQNKLIEENAAFLTDGVIADIFDIGVEKDKIRVTYQKSAMAKSSEVHIFVR